MRYLNIKTGATVETKHELIGGNWRPLEREGADVPAQGKGTESSETKAEEKAWETSSEVKTPDKSGNNGKKAKGAVIRPKKE